MLRWRLCPFQPPCPALARHRRAALLRVVLCCTVLHRTSPHRAGVPDDIFLHDVTDHVDYRGEEYELAGEICDLAAGGQILMGPKTLQR